MASDRSSARLPASPRGGPVIRGSAHAADGLAAGVQLLGGRALLAHQYIDWLSDYNLDNVVSSVCKRTGTSITLYAQLARQGTTFITDVPLAFNNRASSMMIN
ncbi:hypothetical protein ACIPYS_21150 [Kitasatospora sp. NPDC089913]|uniref:hypothetical protein n=1 Tax=Kitasatospora sp. NPDC089913 TaxID=3364080 RepID=UPI0037F37AE0